MSRPVKLLLALSFLLVISSFTAGLLLRLGGWPLGDGRVALLRVEGVIAEVGWHMKMVEQARRDPTVAAMVLRVDSPGGAIAPTQELYQELLRFSGEKPLVVSMGTVAASGGYYLSCAADQVVANPGTITGSIGVVMEFLEADRLLDSLGIRGNVIKSGENKDTGSPFRPMTDRERELLSRLVDDAYGQFVEAVLDARRLDPDVITPYLDGRVFTGRQAQELGLVDRLGNINDALDLAAELAGLEGEPRLLEMQPEKEGVLELLMGTLPPWLLEGSGWGKPASSRCTQLWRAF